MKEICSLFGKVKQVILNRNEGKFINGYVEMDSKTDFNQILSGLSGGSIDGFAVSAKEVDGPNLSNEKKKDSYSIPRRSPPRRRSPVGRRYSRSPPRRYSRSPKRYKHENSRRFESARYKR